VILPGKREDVKGRKQPLEKQVRKVTEIKRKGAVMLKGAIMKLSCRGA
jgi:hypothetical protein